MGILIPHTLAFHFSTISCHGKNGKMILAHIKMFAALTLYRSVTATILTSVLNTQRFLDISAQVVRTGKEVTLYGKKENAD
jgi:hypothetical protein